MRQPLLYLLNKRVDTLPRQAGYAPSRQIGLPQNNNILRLKLNARPLTLIAQKENPQIRDRCTLNRTRDPDLLDFIRSFPQPRRIQQRDWQTAKIHPDLNDIAGRPGNFRGNSDIAFCQRIQKRGFSRIRRPNDRDLEPTAHPLRSCRGIQLRP